MKSVARICFLIFISLTGTEPSTAQVFTPSFRGLGHLPGAFTGACAYGAPRCSTATAVSDNGKVVVGFSSSASASPGAYPPGEEAFRWENGVMVGLGDLPGGAFSSAAYGVSADGSVVVGRGIPAINTFSGPYEAFRWENGVMTSLGGLPGLPGQPPFSSEAYGVSADGSVVVGVAQNPQGSGSEAFRWTQATGMVGLGDLFEAYGTASVGLAVSADGSVVVGQGNSTSGIEAFRWTQPGGMAGLGSLSTVPFFSSANGVSADGSVVVGVSSSGGPPEAFRWSQATGMVSLAGPPIIQSRARAASRDGSVIVGYTYIGPVETDAAIWDQTHGHRLLRDILINDLALDLSGWILNEATAITPDGSAVVGYGKNPSGDQEAWIAVIKAPEGNNSPVANAGPDQIVECAGPSGVRITLNGSSSSDPDGDALSFVWKDSNGNIVGNTASVTLTIPLGSRAYALTVSDGKGGTANAPVTITVRDSTPPSLSLILTPNVLWPPNDKLVPVVARIRLKDVCDPNPSVMLVSITSNEPDTKHPAKGHGRTGRDNDADIQGANFNTDDRSFSLRAERSEKGSERIYTVTYRGRDAAGNTTDATARVTVPHNWRKP